MSKQNTITWRVVPSGAPAIIRHCRKCGRDRRFVQSGKFRVNAQKKRLDVWLIYHCEACRTTWNREIFSRIRPDEIPPELLQRLTENDPAQALRFACVREASLKAGPQGPGGDPAYCIEGPPLPDAGHDPVLLKIIPDFALSVRLDRFLSRALGVSRRVVSSLIDSGEIACLDGKSLQKLRLSGPINLILRPADLSAFYAAGGEN